MKGLATKNLATEEKVVPIFNHIAFQYSNVLVETVL